MSNYESQLERRNDPRISINKLGEYVHCTDPERRKKIVFDARNPSELYVTRYKVATQAIIKYIRTGYDYEAISRTLEALRANPKQKKLQENDRVCSIEALELVDAEILPKLNGISNIRGTSINTKLLINEVTVSVKPNLILRGEQRGEKVVGAIKFHISKSNRLSENARQSVATTLQQFLEEFVARPGEVVKAPLCFSYDVFGQGVSIAPRSFKKRRAKIEAACEEFALWWEKV